MSFGGLGAFPKPARATVLWLSVVRGADRLATMAEIADLAAQSRDSNPRTAVPRPSHPVKDQAADERRAADRSGTAISALDAGRPSDPLSQPSQKGRAHVRSARFRRALRSGVSDAESPGWHASRRRGVRDGSDFSDPAGTASRSVGALSATPKEHNGTRSILGELGRQGHGCLTNLLRKAGI